MAKKIPRELAVIKVGPFIIGSTPGVNDKSAEPVNEFIPTRYELEVLAKHYFNEQQEIHYGWSADGSVGSSEYRFDAFAAGRLTEIGKLLGEEALDALLATDLAKWKEEFRILRASLGPEDRQAKRCLRKEDVMLACEEAAIEFLLSEVNDNGKTAGALNLQERSAPQKGMR